MTILLHYRTFTATNAALIVEKAGNLCGMGSPRSPLPVEADDVNAAPYLESRAGSLNEVDLLGMTNHELDVLFRTNPAGELPAGEVRGTALVFPGTATGRILARLVRWIAWQGKKIDPTRDGLVNRVTPLRLPLIRATVSHGPSWVDGRDCTVIDYSTTSVVARMVRDETRLVAPGLHLGVVWLWRRRAAWFALRASQS